VTFHEACDLAGNICDRLSSLIRGYSFTAQYGCSGADRWMFHCTRTDGGRILTVYETRIEDLRFPSEFERLLDRFREDVPSMTKQVFDDTEDPGVIDPGVWDSRLAPPPKKGGRAVTPEVIADLRKRSEMGKEKYGTVLETDNGRDALVDAYQEALDLCCYLKQKLMETS